VHNSAVPTMKRAAVSILLPVFNAERTLAACLRSIRRQSESSWECVLVDDGSRDDSLSLALRYATGDDRFRGRGVKSSLHTNRAAARVV
jgi:glycosyltransferase involved in cell wall biosynthesis